MTSDTPPPECRWMGHYVLFFARCGGFWPPNAYVQPPHFLLHSMSLTMAIAPI